ncbi:MAG: hypothetical protein WBP56_25405 [Polyangia bacterium]|jgi:hypothetical protein
MSDDTKATPEQQRAAEKRMRRLANLRPARPGERRNPKGVNGITKYLRLFREFLGEQDRNGKPRIRNVWESTYLAALNGNVRAQQIMIEQMQGRANEHIDLSNKDGSLGIPVVRVHFGKVSKSSDGTDETTPVEGPGPKSDGG